MDGFIGEIRCFSFDYAPQSWLRCDGTLYSIQQYTTLFALIGSHYGGDGKSTFAVPNLSGDVLLNQGTDTANNSSYSMYGTSSHGSTSVAVISYNLPVHSHTITPTSGTADFQISSGSTTAGSGMASSGSFSTNFLSNQAPNAVLKGVVTDIAGYDPATIPTQTQPQGIAQPTNINILQPSLAMGYYICIDGVFPSFD